MSKKFSIISVIILMMMFTTTTMSVALKPSDAGIFNRTHIKAIGNFYICEDDGNLYGHILLGLKNFKPIVNSDIEITKDSIKRIVMGGISLNSEKAIYFYLNCVFKE